MIRWIALFIGITALCYDASASNKVSSILPGVSIAGLRLGPDGAETLRKLGKPFATDDGMSQTRQVWKLPRPGDLFDTLFIHATNNGATDTQPADGYTIDLIRVTAKRYKTQQGISVGSTLDQIQKAFPDAAPIDTIPTVYDASKEGIAFEFEKTPAASSVCIAIMVHTPGGGQIATQENVGAVMEEHGKN